MPNGFYFVHLLNNAGVMFLSFEARCQSLDHTCPHQLPQRLPGPWSQILFSRLGDNFLFCLKRIAARLEAHGNEKCKRESREADTGWISHSHNMHKLVTNSWIKKVQGTIQYHAVLARECLYTLRLGRWYLPQLRHQVKKNDNKETKTKRFKLWSKTLAKSKITAVTCFLALHSCSFNSATRAFFHGAWRRFCSSGCLPIPWDYCLVSQLLLHLQM